MADLRFGKSWFFRFVIVAIIVVGVMAIFHRAVLRWAALPLVHEQVPAELDYIVLQQHTRRDPEVYDLVVQLLPDHPRTKVVLLHHGASRALRSGAIPSFEQVCRAEFSRRDVDDIELTVISYASNSFGHIAATLERWLDENPGTALLICDRFSSRLSLTMFNQSRPRRVAVAGLPLKAIDENNWWHSTTGIKGVLVGYIDYFHFLWKGRCDEPGEPWNPADYEQWLKHQQKNPVGDAA